MRAAVPAATFYIIGRTPTRAVRRLAAAPGGVVVTGAVPDLLARLDRLEVYVCPMRFSSGMKMKIVEALSRDLPVVTTAVGAEGMDNLQAGRDFMVADEPAAFADAVIGLWGCRRPAAPRRRPPARGGVLHVGRLRRVVGGYSTNSVGTV